MKKNGFTLAELLLSLTIIGVIATMTIPTLVQRTHAKANVAKLASSVAAIENALSNMIVSEAATDLTETSFQDGDVNSLQRYLKLTRFGNSLNDSPIAGANFFQLKNGAIITVTSSPVAPTEERVGSIGFISIDVNGSTNPNSWGNDCFKFRIGNNGSLYPAGGAIYDDMGSDTNDKGNNVGNTATIVENNYKID